MNECIFDIDPKLLSLASEAENECREMFEKIDSNAEYNGQKVLKAFLHFLLCMGLPECE